MNGQGGFTPFSMGGNPFFNKPMGQPQMPTTQPGQPCGGCQQAQMQQQMNQMMQAPQMNQPNSKLFNKLFE